MSQIDQISRFYSHGKLLLFGEYLVLDGALALAVPTQKGQLLTVKPASEEKGLYWKSYDVKGGLWFEGRYSMPEGRYLEGNDDQVGSRLAQLLQAGRKLAGKPWMDGSKWGFKVETRLEFPRDWGLGSSSTLVAGLARWWQVDPYVLLAGTFGGSGYDLACAEAEGPVFYRRENGKAEVKAAGFHPPFSHQLFFLFLEQKQNSRTGIARYRERGRATPGLIREISRYSEEATQVNTLREFQSLMEKQETLIGDFLGVLPVQQSIFPDFSGRIKSLGAWGGDFVLVASDQPLAVLQAYFSTLGFPTLIPYSEMVLDIKNFD